MRANNSIKICLLNMPYGTRDELGCFLPLSLVHLGTLLKQAGYDITLYDLHLWGMKKQINFESPRAAKTIARRICNKANFRYFLFVSMDNGLPLAVNLAAEFKKLKPLAKIIFGGTQASLVARQILAQYPFIDYIVRHEAEITLIELLSCLKQKKSLAKVKGIAYREEAKVILTPPRPLIRNLDKIPFADFSLIKPLRQYQPDKKSKGFVAHLDVGRGCPFRCGYCSTSLFWQNKIRQKTPERIMKEMSYLYKRFGITDFIFNHDQFISNKRLVYKFCRIMSQSKLPLSWRCYARIEALDKEMIRYLALGKCGGVFLGIESASKRLLKLSNKRIDINRVERIVQALTENKIECMASFIIGFPDERPAELAQTLLLAVKLRRAGCLIEISLLQPYWGSKFWKLYSNRIKLYPEYLNFHYAYLSAEEKARIKENKEIFSCFYNYRTKHYSLKFYYELSQYYFIIMNALPDLLYFLAKDVGLSLVEVFHAWRRWLRKKRLEGTFLRKNCQEKIIIFRSFVLQLDNPPAAFEQEDLLSLNRN